MGVCSFFIGYIGYWEEGRREVPLSFFSPHPGFSGDFGTVIAIYRDVTDKDTRT